MPTEDMYRIAQANVQRMVEENSLTFLGLEEALQGLTVYQRIRIKQTLRQAGMLI